MFDTCAAVMGLYEAWCNTGEQTHEQHIGCWETEPSPYLQTWFY